MNQHIRRAAWLLGTAFAPLTLSAQNFLGIEFSDVTLTAFTSVSTQLAPIQTATDTRTAPQATASSVETLLTARGIPFPNLPNSVGSSFTSSTGDNTGAFGVGVNGFFFTNSLPPDALLASGSYVQTISNRSSSSVTLFADVSIPAPLLLFFGVGDSFPPGGDPRRDVTGLVNASFFSKITHANGLVEESTPLDYGMSVFRDPASGVLFALASDSAGGGVVPRFLEPDGSFGFELPAFHGENIEVGVIAPGDTLEFSFEYFASASTGFGETGIFAAIGDPFELSASGSGLVIQIGAPIPEPAPWAMLAVGLAALILGTRRIRR
jgi:hypothetical protein